MVASVRAHVRVLGTCDIFRVHSLPFGRESSIREATVGLKCDRYRVAGADQDGGEDVAAEWAWRWRRARREKRERWRWMRRWSRALDNAAVQIRLINSCCYADYTVQFDG